MLLFSYMKDKDRDLQTARDYEISVVDSARESFSFTNVRGSVSIKGLVLDELFYKNNSILQQEKGTKLLVAWDGDGAPDVNSIWSIKSKDNNSIVFEYKNYLVKIEEDGDRLLITQKGNGTKHCKVVTHYGTGNVREVITRNKDNVQWFAVDGKYFSIVFFPSTLISSLYKNDIHSYSMENKETISILITDKNLDNLKKNHLEGLINFGRYMWFITKPSFYLINFMEKYISFGSAIVLFCIFTKLLVLPVSWNIYKSTKKMNSVQSEIHKLKQLYGDGDAFRREVAALFRKEKINPLVSILSLLVQMPVFIALFATFPILFGAYKAKFLWMEDLSSFDLIMFTISVSSTLLSYISAPNQSSSMMILFPIVFAFFTYGMSSGLLLGITMNNILMFAQTRIFSIMRY